MNRILAVLLAGAIMAPSPSLAALVRVPLVQAPVVGGAVGAAPVVLTTLTAVLPAPSLSVQAPISLAPALSFSAAPAPVAASAIFPTADPAAFAPTESVAAAMETAAPAAETAAAPASRVLSDAAAALTARPAASASDEPLRALFDQARPLAAASAGVEGVPASGASSSLSPARAPSAGRGDALVAAAVQSAPRGARSRTRAAAALALVAALAPVVSLAAGTAALGVVGFGIGAALAYSQKDLVRRIIPAESPLGRARDVGRLGVVLTGAAVAAASLAIASWSAPAAAVLLSLTAITGLSRSLEPLRRALFPSKRPRGFLGVSMRPDGAAARLEAGDFGRLFMLSATLEKGVGEKDLYAQLMWGMERLVYFRRSGDRVELMARNASIRSAPGGPLSNAVEVSAHGDAVLGSARVAEQDADAVEIDLSELFGRDPFRLSDELAQRFGGAYSPEKDGGRIESAKAYPRNAELSARVVFEREAGAFDEESPSHVPDLRRVPLTVRLSLSALPGAGFEPRRADVRIGHFSHVFQDWTDPRGEVESSIITRWRLEKEDPSAAVSKVKNPIVYWLDPSVPKEFRPAVTRGILAWNRSFERVGLLGAVEVREAPEDGSFDASDIRNSVISWRVDQDAGYAIGPSRSDPLTGEIYQGSISLSAQHLRAAWGLNFKELAESDFDERPDAKDHSKKHDHEHEHGQGSRCGYGAEAARQAAMTLALFSARGEVMTEEQRRRFAEDYIVDLVMHEAGHTLGLRHNFSGKTWRTLEQIEAGAYPLSASVMDYYAANLARPGTAQGPVWNTQLGPYDDWAIEYAYKPLDGLSAAEKDAALSAIADRAVEPGHAYSTDEDLDAGDPETQAWMLGSDAVAFARGRMASAREVWAWLESAPLPAPKAYKAFVEAWREYRAAERLAATVLGGVSRRRGAAARRATPEKQREALTMLDAELFSDAAFAASPALRARLVSGQKPTLKDPWPAPFEIPYEDMVLWLRQDALERLLSPDVLERIAQSSRLESDKRKALTLRRYLDRLDQIVWRELDSPATKGLAISALRRKTQEFYLNLLLDVAYAKGGDEIPEVSTAVRAHLERMVLTLDGQSTRRGWNSESRDHIQQQLAKLIKLGWEAGAQ